MNIQEIIFKIISRSPQVWVRYWKDEPTAVLQHEYVELRSGFISSYYLDDLLEAGFKIDLIKVQKINQDAYSDVLLKKNLY